MSSAVLEKNRIVSVLMKCIASSQIQSLIFHILSLYLLRGECKLSRHLPWNSLSSDSRHPTWSFLCDSTAQAILCLCHAQLLICSGRRWTPFHQLLAWSWGAWQPQKRCHTQPETRRQIPRIPGSGRKGPRARSCSRRLTGSACRGLFLIISYITHYSSQSTSNVLQSSNFLCLLICYVFSQEILLNFYP